MKDKLLLIQKLAQRTLVSLLKYEFNVWIIPAKDLKGRGDQLWCPPQRHTNPKPALIPADHLGDLLLKLLSQG